MSDVFLLMVKDEMMLVKNEIRDEMQKLVKNEMQMKNEMRRKSKTIMKMEEEIAKLKMEMQQQIKASVTKNGKKDYIRN